MPPIDWAMLANWIVSGLIGMCFGVVGAYVIHRFTRLRDDLRWEREKSQLDQQWRQEKETMEMAWQQKLHELEIQFLREDQNRLRNQLLIGLENPTDAIQTLIRSVTVLRREQVMSVWSDRELQSMILRQTDIEDIQMGLALLERLKALKATELAKGTEEPAAKELESSKS